MLTPLVIKVFWVLPWLLLCTAGMFVGFSMILFGIARLHDPQRRIVTRHLASLRPLLRPVLMLRLYRRNKICGFFTDIARSLAVSAVVMAIVAAVVSVAHSL
jgi:hypothetical protein